VNLAGWLLAVAYFLEKSMFFGWHRAPTSGEEVIADGVFLMLVTLAAGNR